MNELENKELSFQETIKSICDSYGDGSQEGVKASLKECQKIFDCVSVAHQHQIADLFRVDHKVVATLMKFMKNLKESIVEYEIICCTGARCAKNGSVEVIRAVKETLGIDFNEATSDGRIRLSTQNCFKQCHLGPNVMVNGVFHHRMDRTKAIALIKSIK